MKLVKVGNLMINMDEVEYLKATADSVEVYFDAHRDDPPLTFRGQQAADFNAWINRNSQVTTTEP